MKKTTLSMVVAMSLGLCSSAFAQNPFADLQKAMNNSQKGSTQTAAPSKQPAPQPANAQKTAAPANESGATSKPLTTADEIAAIPLEDSGNNKDAKDFAKNWKGKTISITGKVNNGGGVSIDEFYVTGCSAALKGTKPNTTVTVTGTLTSRNRGGSGGEPVGLSNCRIGGQVSATAAPNAAATTSIPAQFLGFWDVKQQNCKKIRDTDSFITVKSKTINRYELACDLISIVASTEQSITVKMSCESEGDKETQSFSLSLLQDGKLLVNKEAPPLVRCK